MFCPKCGTENLESASFCRGCGSNIALVPQALTGTLRDPAARDDQPLSRRERREIERERREERKREREGRKKASVEHAVVPFFGGIGFVVVAFAIMFFMPGGAEWGFWMFIPAFFMIGAGVSEYMRWKQSQKSAPSVPAYTPPSVLSAPHTAAELRPPRATAEIYAPGSVTEGTTKLLERDQ
jgi:zinc-ribbon domain